MGVLADGVLRVDPLGESTDCAYANPTHKQTMKKTLLALAALLSVAGLRAEEAAAPSYSVVTDFTYVSKYVFRGVQASEQSFQPSVTVSGNGFTLGVWSAQALEEQDAAWAQGNEIDIFGIYAFTFEGGYALTLGATSYQYPSARASLGELDSTFETSLGFSAPLGPVTASLTYFHDFDLDADTFEGTVSYSGTINDAASYGVAGSYGLANFDAGGDYDYYSLKATLSYKVTKGATLTVGVNWADTDIAGLDDNAWVSVGVSAGF